MGRWRPFCVNGLTAIASSVADPNVLSGFRRRLLGLASTLLRSPRTSRERRGSRLAKRSAACGVRRSVCADLSAVSRCAVAAAFLLAHLPPSRLVAPRAAARDAYRSKGGVWAIVHLLLEFRVAKLRNVLGKSLLEVRVRQAQQPRSVIRRLPRFRHVYPGRTAALTDRHVSGHL